MIVTIKSLSDVIDRFKKTGRYAVDTETTGLNVYHGDRLFSIILADELGACYFNFQERDDIERKFVLPEDVFGNLNNMVFSNPESTWYIHNAKFDMGMLLDRGIEIRGTIHDTEVVGRILENHHFQYGLDAQLKRLGRAKNDTVKKYVSVHKLYDNVVVPGKKQKIKMMHYEQVPFEIIAPYGLDDGRDARFLGEHQRQEVAAVNTRINSETKVLKDGTTNTDRFNSLALNESQLVKTCFKMEQVGIKINRGYCEQADQAEQKRIKEARENFEGVCGYPLIDSAKCFSQIFTPEQTAHLRRTKTGISYDDSELGKLDSPLVPFIRQHRKATKLSSTYFRNYLYYADHNNVIHPNMRQAGTATGRFSYSDPNLQNVPKAKDEEDSSESLAVRRCFVPREGFCLGMLDYDQMEYRLMLDYAQEMHVIQKVLGGLDVHQATADMLGVSRFQAKTINFLLLYGGGAQKFADALDMPIEKAKQLKQRYFETLTQVTKFIRGVINRAEKRGYVYNWMGRPYQFPEFYNPKTGKLDRGAFKAPNYVIQGGCSDIVRLAMNRIDQFIMEEGLLSRIVLQIHDELVFEIHNQELDIVNEFKRIMEQAYPARHLPLTCGIDHSWKSWGDKVKGPPQIQRVIRERPLYPESAPL